MKLCLSKTAVVLGREPGEGGLKVSSSSYVSRRHCEIQKTLDGGFISVKDTSTNGTFVSYGEGKLQIIGKVCIPFMKGMKLFLDKEEFDLQ